MIPKHWLTDLEAADIYRITTRIEEQLAHLPDEVTLTAIEAEQTLRALRIHLLMMHRGRSAMTPDLAELRRLAEAANADAVRGATYERDWPLSSRAVGRFLRALNPDLAIELLDAAAERDALAAKVERLTGELVNAGYRQAEDRAEIEALRSQLAGRCLSDVTHRDEEHRQSLCMLPAEHAPLAHDDYMGCTWTDADHWQPQAVDRVADELQRIADESQHESWDHPLVRNVVARLTAALNASADS